MSTTPSTALPSSTKMHEYICHDCGKTTKLSGRDTIKCSHCRKCKILFKPRCAYTLQYEAR